MTTPAVKSIADAMHKLTDDELTELRALLLSGDADSEQAQDTRPRHRGGMAYDEGSFEKMFPLSSRIRHGF